MKNNLEKLDQHIGKLEQEIGELYTHCAARVVGKKKGNPQLVYDLPSPETLQGWYQRASDIPLDFHAYDQVPPEVRLLFCWKREDLLRRISAIGAIGTAAFIEHCKDLYIEIKIGNDELRHAVTILRGDEAQQEPAKEKAEEKDRCCDAAAIAAAFFTSLVNEGLQGWRTTIQQGKDAADIAVNIPAKEILIQEKATKTEIQLKKSLMHELQHIRRYLAGALQPYPSIMSCGIDQRYEITEEGLTGYLEEVHHLDLNRKTHAAQLVAVYRVLQGASYRDIVVLLQDYNVPEKKAKKIAFRVKRGICDTSQPGGFIKDAVYLLGNLRLKKVLQECATPAERKSLIEKLNAARYDITHLSLINALEAKGLIAVPRLPEAWQPFIWKPSPSLLTGTNI